MVASPAMPAMREVPIAAALALLAGATFFGGGPGDTSLVWLAAIALAGLVVAAAVYGAPPGLLWLLPLAALVAWLALTIAWSFREVSRFSTKLLSILSFARGNRCR